MMNNSRTILASVTAVFLSSTCLEAAPIVATATTPPGTVTTIDEVTFAADVSATDLLTGLVGTGGTWTNLNGADVSFLNDGLAGGDFEADGLAALVGKAWATNGDGVSFREFELGLGNGFGYDLTEIQSIASWNGAGFPNQKYDVSVRLVGDVAYTPLVSADYQPLPTGGGSTKINITDDTGLLATGVEAIRFDINDSSSNGSFGTVFSEIDVFGTASIPEPSSISVLLLTSLLGVASRRR